MKIIRETLEDLFQYEHLRRTQVPLFMSNPGLGKTSIIESFAEEKKVNLIEIITSQVAPYEVSGICIPDKDLKRMVYYNLDRLESLQDGDIIFFDEILNGNPAVLNACLTLLESRKLINGKPLPDVLIVAAGNPQGAAPLTPQIKERFVWWDVKFDSVMWSDYMIQKYQMTATIADKLCNLIKAEKFTGYNFCTPRSIDKAVNSLTWGARSPYESILEPILSEIITNKLEIPVRLHDSTLLQPNESLTWINLKKYKNGVIKK